MLDRILIAVPAWNEGAAVGRVVEDLKRHLEGANYSARFDIVVVDDGSVDSTPDIAHAFGAKVISHQRNLGYGAALKTAFRFALTEGYDYVVTFDGDGQHSHLDIDGMIVRRSNADVVSGSRYLMSSIVIDPAPDPVTNNLFRDIANIMFGLEISDVGCGLKCIRTSTISDIDFQEDGYFFPLEFWADCGKRRRKITESPVRMIYNNKGRNIRAKFGSVERAYDEAFFVVVRSIFAARVPYSPFWSNAAWLDPADVDPVAAEKLAALMEFVETSHVSGMPRDELRRFGLRLGLT